jgi:hypothetical protein
MSSLTTEVAPQRHQNDFDFTLRGPPPNDGKKHGRGGFGLQKSSGKLQLCPTGDCQQSVLAIAMERLIEVDAKGNPTKNKADNFNKMDFAWTAPTSAVNDDGVNITTSSFNAVVPVGDQNVIYKAQIAFYAQNGTALNGKQIIDVPAGGLKFAVWIENWPFLSDANKLRLGIRVMTRNKKGEQKPKADREKGRGRDKLIERLNLGDDMFLDSPVLAEIDKTMQNVTAYVASPVDGFVMVEYEFPKFKSLYYDPVMSSQEQLDDSTKLRSHTTRPLLQVMMSVGALVVATGAMFML